MIVTIKNIERIENSQDYYIVFNYLNREGRIRITPAIKKYHKREEFFSGQNILVWKTIKNNKTFYFLKKCL